MKKPPKKLVISVSLLVIIGGGAALGYHLLSGSATGTITVKTSKPVTAAVAVPYVQQTGRYASFNYPSNFSATKANPAIAPTLLTYDYTRSQGGSASLDVGIYSLPGGDLNQDSTYHYRKAYPGQYTFTSVDINGTDVPLVTDKTLGGYNQVAYLRHGSYDATISLQSTTALNTTDMSDIMTAILRSWQWQ